MNQPKQENRSCCVAMLQFLSKIRQRNDCGNSAEIPQEQCGKSAEMPRKQYGVVKIGNAAGATRKDWGDAAETVLKDYRSSADIVQTKCGATAVPLWTRHRSALLSVSTFNHQRAPASCLQRLEVLEANTKLDINVLRNHQHL